MEIDNYQFSCEYKNKQLELYIIRMKKARLWVLIVFSYYLLRAALVIYPKYSKFDDFTKFTVMIQTAISAFLILAFIYSFKVKIDHFYWALYIQAIQMCLSNFNGYDEDDTKNFEGFKYFSNILGQNFIKFLRSEHAMLCSPLNSLLRNIFYLQYIFGQYAY